MKPEDPKVCPQCGAAIQATVVREAYYTLSPDGARWNAEDVGDLGVRYYCANDCPLGPAAIDRLPALP